MDLEAAKAQLTKFKRRHKVDVIPISCATGAGLEELKEALWTRVRGRRTRTRALKAAPV